MAIPLAILMQKKSFRSDRLSEASCERAALPVGTREHLRSDRLSEASCERAATLSGRQVTAGWNKRRAMERYQTMRAYSAGGVVFRLVPGPSPIEGYSEEVDASNGYHTSGATNGSQTKADIDKAPSVEVVLVGRSHSGIWTLPKGTPQSGETIEQVAVREVQEETGLVVRLISYIGSISYSFVRNQVRYQKQVRHFLFEANGGDTSLHDTEYDRVEWFSLAEASRRLTYQNEVNILYQADDILQRWLEHQRKEGL